jgi:putative multiple sugar transport system permease protein
MSTFTRNIRKVLQQNVREYGMYLALFAIMAFFTIATNGLFISAQNIANLVNQTGYIAVLAVGMTLVIVIRHIDLSVGYLGGFLGAVVAIAMARWHLPVYIAIPLTLALGVVAGLITAFLVAQLKIPAFVATLASGLIYRGAILLVTERTGILSINDDVFNAIAYGFVPDIFPADSLFLPGIHKLTLILGILAIVLLLVSQINSRRKKQADNFEVLPLDIFILKLVFISALIGYVTWLLASYRGLSWTAVIVLGVAGVYDFIVSKTMLGRLIYAVGGNPEVAELSGIRVKKITYVVFGSMGMLTALASILYGSSRFGMPIVGVGWELDAIAAAFIGGAPPAGGIGKVVGAIVGAFVMMSLTSGMNLMGIGISYQYIARGVVLALAVIFDVATRNRAKRVSVQAAGI